jgi:serine/threonine-protein kinase
LRLGARIGRGGMAEVFAARLVGVAGFEKDVAVKRVLPKFAGDTQFLERFFHEARLAARLSHPNVVQIFELGNDGRDHYLVMEAVRGVNLRAALAQLSERKERMAPPIALHIAQCVCAGLAHAHESRGSDGKPLGIVHRDVSPQNVLLAWDGTVKLIDFGIARAKGASSGLTETGKVVGKAHFLAPEQITGKPVDARADVFAVGVVAYEMLAGRRPFEGTDLEAMERIAHGKFPLLREVAPDVDARVAAVIHRALAHDPEARWDSARAMQAALVEASGTRGDPGELEALLRRLFADKVELPWPVEIEASEGGDHTRTVDIARDPSVTDPSRDVGSGEGDTRDTTLLQLPQRAGRTRARAPLIAASAVVLVVALLAWSQWPAALAPDVARDAGTSAGRELAPAADAGALVDAGVLAETTADAGESAGQARAPQDAVEGALDAGVADEPVAESGHRKKRVKMQKLTVDTRPWSNVKMDGRALGITPLSVNVPVGPHTLTLTNAEQKLSRTVKVNVTADEPEVVRLDLRR